MEGEQEQQSMPMQDLTAEYIRIGDDEIAVADEHRVLLGMSLERLSQTYTTKPINSHTFEVLQSLDTYTREHFGLYGMDYLFLRYRYQRISLLQLGHEIGLKDQTIQKIFEKLHIPLYSKQEMRVRALQRRAREYRTEIENNIAAMEARPTTDIPTQYQLGSKVITIKEEDKVYFGRSIADIEKFLSLSLATNLKHKEILIQKLYHVNLFDYILLQYRYERASLLDIAEKLKCSQDDMKRMFHLLGFPTFTVAERGTYMQEHQIGIFSEEYGSPEARKELGRQTARKQKENGTGVYGFTKEQRQQLGHKGGTTTRNRRTGFFALPKERLKAIGERARQRSREVQRAKREQQKKQENEY